MEDCVGIGLIVVELLGLYSALDNIALSLPKFGEPDLPTQHISGNDMGSNDI